MGRAGCFRCKDAPQPWWAEREPSVSLPTDVSHATQRVMRSTGKHPKIQQRWASTEYDDEPSSSGYASAPPQPPSKRRRVEHYSNNSYEDNSDDDERRPLARARPPAAAPDDDEPPLFSSRRLALECAILLFILSWLAALGVLFASRYEECRGAQASHYGRFVNIASASGALSWTVGKDGVLGTTRHHPANATFLVEYRGGDKTWFCLRAARAARRRGGAAARRAAGVDAAPRPHRLHRRRRAALPVPRSLDVLEGRRRLRQPARLAAPARPRRPHAVDADAQGVADDARLRRGRRRDGGEAVAVNERLLALVSNFDADAQRSTAVPG